MDKAQLLELLDVGPVIASVKDEAGLSAALKSDVGVIFLLFGDVLNIGEMVGRAHAAGKAVFVHLDLVDGLASPGGERGFHRTKHSRRRSPVYQGQPD